MAGDESLYATKGYTSVIRWVDPEINIDAYTVQRVLHVGSNTAIAGDVVTGAEETQGYVDLAAADDTGFLGVILQPTVLPENYDLDDVITDGETVNVLRPTGGRTIISVILASNTAALSNEEGDYVSVDIQGVAGQVSGWVYTDTDMDTDTLALVVGKVVAPITSDTADYQVINIWY